MENPRAAIERQEHHFAPDHSRLLDLGYKPTHDVASEVLDMLEDLLPYRERVAKHQQALLPNVHWNGSRHRVSYLPVAVGGQGGDDVGLDLAKVASRDDNVMRY